MQKHTLHGAEIGAVRRKERWSLSSVAVREAIINAVVHTDYAQRGAPLRVSIFDDRLEVENPGLLPFGLTIEDLPHGVSKLRKRVIGRVFHVLLSLMFYKRLCDQWECEADDAIAELKRQQGRAFSEKEKAVFRKRGEHRFKIPDGSRWSDVKAASTNIGIDRGRHPRYTAAIPRVLRYRVRPNPFGLP